ncbi:MAG: hypothetical protein CL678_18485 [Bdellovibrionaceae bacterium]|nr:hypothetical protein [Pseudobdellovibrionaceae bacterium]
MLMALILLVGFFWTVEIFAKEQKKDWHLGAKIGAHFGGNITTGNQINTRLTPSFSGEIFFDYELLPYLDGSAIVGLQTIPIGFGNNSLTDFSLGLSVPFMIDGFPLTVRPGVALGYATIFNTTINANSNDYFAFRGFVEFAYHIDEIQLLLDTGVFYTPIGGNTFVQSRVGPLGFVRGGIRW